MYNLVMVAHIALERALPKEAVIGKAIPMTSGSGGRGGAERRLQADAVEGGVAFPVGGILETGARASPHALVQAAGLAGWCFLIRKPPTRTTSADAPATVIQKTGM
jgi:hypothetical protein